MGACKKQKEFEMFAALYKKYANEDGYLPTHFVSPEGAFVGAWSNNIRRGRIILNPEREKILEEINFLWDISSYLRRRTALKHKTKARKRKTFDEWLAIFDDWNKDGYIPADFVTPNGETIGRWAARIRSGNMHITPEQREKLCKRNFAWTVPEELWKYYKDRKK